MANIMYSLFFQAFLIVIIGGIPQTNQSMIARAIIGALHFEYFGSQLPTHGPLTFNKSD
jgi:branched-subunit amino acid ABC-type transport system permease component